MLKISRLKNFDVTILTTIFALCVMGGLVVFSTTYFLNFETSRQFYNQLLFYGIGFVLLIFISLFDYTKLNSLPVVIFFYLFNIVALLAVLQFGETIYGAKRWINFGPFNLQPAEFAKLSVILYSAYFYSRKERKSMQKTKDKYKLLKQKLSFINTSYFRRIVVVFLLTIGLVMLILMQNSLGNAILIFAVTAFIAMKATPLNKQTIGYLSILLLSFNLSFELFDPVRILGFKTFNSELLSRSLILILISLIAVVLVKNALKLNIVIAGLLFISLLPLSYISSYTYYNKLEDYQRNRIEAFVSPEKYDQGLNWNRRQAIIALGSGRLLGKGFLKGTQVNVGNLPFAHTDFAFAAFGEQFGFIGCVSLLALYLILLIRILEIADGITDKFGKFLCYGVTALILFNTIQHTGMNQGQLPITGVPLPLISYGGSSILTVFLGLGLVMSIQNYEKNKVEKIVNFNKLIKENKI